MAALTYLTASLFDSPAQTLVNPVNTVGVMGKGLAAEFKARWPEMFAAYHEACFRGNLRVGRLCLWRGPRWVLNFPTKAHWREPSQIAYLETGLNVLADVWMHWGVTSLAFPQLGCGAGGLDWADVRPVMEKRLRALPIPVYIHIADGRK